MLELGNWRRKPNDPCFIGLELHSRIVDITSRLQRLQDGIAAGKVLFSSRETKVLNRVLGIFEETLATLRPLVEDLGAIRGHIAGMVAILDEWEASAEHGLSRMRKFCANLRLFLNETPQHSHERLFLEALFKFIETKGDLLFNYREISGAPTTNNDLELRFKQIKHLLRRTIGHAAAKYYLMMHGERIFYVNPQEPIEQILQILRNMDQTSARNQIKDERQSQDRLALVIHDDVRWRIVIDSLERYMIQLGCID